MKNFLSLMFILSCAMLCKPTLASNEEKMKEILSVAKYSGACGILKSMSVFQNSTKMSGGDEFVQRYWSAEAARLGKTPEQYITDCNKYISLYQQYWKAFEPKK